jgi:hypothetical protein
MALERPEDIEAVADGLTALAETLHRRLMKAIKAGQVDQPTALGLFQEEAQVRRQANALYADAASKVVQDLALPQKELLATVAKAKDRIQAIEDFRTWMELLGDIVVLGTAILAGKPALILAAVKELKNDAG